MLVSYLFNLIYIADFGRFVASYHTRVNFSRPITSVSSEMDNCRTFFCVFNKWYILRSSSKRSIQILEWADGCQFSLCLFASQTFLRWKLLGNLLEYSKQRVLLKCTDSIACLLTLEARLMYWKANKRLHIMNYQRKSAFINKEDSSLTLKRC